MLQFIEKNDFRSLGYILKANGRLCRVYKKVTLYGVKFYWTALHMATFHGKIECVSTLIRYGANVEDQDTWHRSRALGWAANSGHAALCKMLIEEYGADQYAVNASGYTAFDLVLDQSNPVWKGIFADASKISATHNPKSQVDDTTKETTKKSQIRLFIRPERSDADNELKVRPPGVSLPVRGPGRPSLKIKLGSNPNIVQNSHQPPLKKVILRVPRTPSSSKSSVQPQPQQQKEEPAVVPSPSKIILRPRKIPEQKKKTEDEMPAAQVQSPQQPSSYVEIEPSQPAAKSYPASKMRLAPPAADFRSPLTLLSFTAANPLQDRNLFFSETISPSVSAISSSKFVNALRGNFFGREFYPFLIIKVPSNTNLLSKPSKRPSLLA